MSKQEPVPVAWLHTHPTMQTYAVITNHVRNLWLAAQPKHVENYTIPLYDAAPACEPAPDAELDALTDKLWRAETNYSLCRSAAAAIASLRQQNAELVEAMLRIVQWSDAYPLAVFPMPDWKKASAVLEAAGMTLDSISAANMRHVVEGVGKIAQAAIAKQVEGKA